MLLKEVEIITGAKVVIGQGTNLNGHTFYHADLKNVEIKGYGVLVSCVGVGSTPNTAKKALCKYIKGQLLIINAYWGCNRKEIQLPPKVTLK